MQPPSNPSRRILLRGAGAAAALLPIAAMAPLGVGRRTPDPLSGPICRVSDALVGPVAPPGTKLRLTWNANAICTVGVPVAEKQGLFARRGLDVELVNFGGSTDQLLEAISTGKADAGIGMALRWLKSLEGGFDVKITTAIHGGCMRLFATQASGIRTIADLKGKTIGCSDMAAPDKNFFSIVAAKQGLDPERDIQWRAFPADLLSVALQKGEIQAFSQGDPLGWMARERDGLHEVANNLQGEYAGRVCCVLGVRGNLVRQDRTVAGALTAALLDAQEYVVSHPDESAALFAEHSPVPAAQLAAMLRSHTHHVHPTGDGLRSQVAQYSEDLKLVHVLRDRTDPVRFADKITADVLAA